METPTEEDPLTGVILYKGPYQLPYKALNVLCADGVRRTARLGESESAFTIRAMVQAHGKAITGFIWTRSTDQQICFTPNSNSRNAHLLEWQLEWQLESSK